MASIFCLSQRAVDELLNKHLAVLRGIMANSTSPAFDRYLGDYTSARSDALRAIELYAKSSNAAKREELVVDARSAVDEVERYIRVLENEAKEGNPSAAAKRKMNAQILHCQTELTSLRASLEKEILVGDARGINAKSKIDSNEPDTNDPKQQTVRIAERIDRTGRHLDEAQRTLAETEAIANNVSNNLMEQRNQLEHAQMNVDQTRVDTDEAGGHLRRLACKAITSKIVLIVIILALMVAIALVSYYKWYPRNKKDYLGILPSSNSTSGS